MAGPEGLARPVTADPLVSVLLPVHNGGDHLQEAISSILNQTYRHFELVIIDDASTDLSYSVCRGFDDPRIVLLRNGANYGIPASLNRGLSIARGELIARIDADDLALPARLEAQVNAFRLEPNLGLVGSWMQAFGERAFVSRYPVDSATIRLSTLFRTPFGHPSVMFRARWLYGEKGYYNENLPRAQDYELWARIVRLWECRNLPQVLTVYRMHPAQATKSRVTERESAVHSIAAKQRNFYGLPELPLDATMIQIVRWWSRVERLLTARPGFEGAEFKTARAEHLTLSFRAKVKRTLETLKILGCAVSVRNTIEVWVKTGMSEEENLWPRTKTR